MKDDRVYLQHVRDSLAWIREYTVDGQEVFLRDHRTQDAVIRNLEVIGEAVKPISENTRLLRPEIPWTKIAGMRDILIHHYFGVKLETVWQVVETELGPLALAVEELLGQLPESPGD